MISKVLVANRRAPGTGPKTGPVERIAVSTIAQVEGKDLLMVVT